MVEYEEDYLLPTAVSLIACFVFLAVMALYITSTFVQKINSSPTKATIALDIVIKEDPNKLLKKQTQNTKLAKSLLKDSPSEHALSKRAKTTSSLDDLFANLDEKYDKVIKKKASHIDSSKVASKRKTKMNEQAKYSSKDIADILDSVDESVSSSSKLIQNDNKHTNAYYAKIRQILSSRWQPSSIKDTLYAMVIVKIDKDGRFSYKFLSYSEDEDFNINLTNFLDSQISQIYPVRKNGDSAVIEVKFGVKGVEL